MFGGVDHEGGILAETVVCRKSKLVEVGDNGLCDHREE